MKYDLNQAPKEFKGQTAKFRKAWGSVEQLPNDWLWQLKYDGCLGIVDTTCKTMLSRTGEAVLSMNHVAEAVSAVFPGMVVFGEVWSHGRPFKEISGAFRRRKPALDMDFVIFDAVPASNWLGQRRYDEPYSARLRVLEEALVGSPIPALKSATGGDLSSLRGTSAHPTAPILDMAIQMQGFGWYDGLIVRNPDSCWLPGAAKNGEAIKVKPRQRLTLEVVSWFDGKGKHEGRAGGITVLHKNVATDVGTGFTDADREAILEYDGHFPLAEIECLGIDSDTGRLREPSFIGWRADAEAD